MEITRQGTRLAPDELTLYENLVNYALALQRFDEARQIIRETQARKPDNYIFPAALYALAFLASDSTAMAEQEQWFAGKPEYENFGLALASNTEAFGGRLGKVRELTVVLPVTFLANGKAQAVLRSFKDYDSGRWTRRRIDDRFVAFTQ